METAFYPYADLFRDFSASLCRPNSSLVTCGYGFGDDHVNRAIIFWSKKSPATRPRLVAPLGDSSR
jgi:hypothetical protein